MEFGPTDWALLGGIAVFAVVGLFRGLSGELGALAGLVAALVAGYFGHAPLQAFLQSAVPGFTSWGSPAAYVADFLMAIVAFGVTRMIVSRFVSFLVPQPTNALMGALAGAAKGAVIVAALLATGFLPAPRCEALAMLGSCASAYIAGAAAE